uniref:GPI transamidase component PIG-S n=1 Tax=Physcomitrium patens TaxID=3218 RepID=A0A7I4AHX5_PHYPA
MAEVEELPCADAATSGSEAHGSGHEGNPASATESGDVDAEASTRSKPPGRKRLFITFSVVFFFLLGVPFWWKSTEVYRAPLPFSAIEEHAAVVASSSLALALPCHLHIIFTSAAPHRNEGLMSVASLEKVAESFRQHAQGYDFGIRVTWDADDSCVSVGSDVEWTWPCGLANSDLLNVDLRNDDYVDEFLWSFAKDKSSSAGGRYTLVVVERKPGEDAKERTVVGKHRHAWMTGADLSVPDFEDGIASRIAEVAVIYFRNGGRVSKAGRAEDDQVPSMPLSADGEAILSFTLLNANPEDWIYDWDIEEVEERYLQPLIDVMEPVARFSVESQVLYYTPKAVSSHWNEALKAHLVPFKQLPFFVNSNEWHLDTSSAATGRSKILHFAIYVPAANECPLHMQLSSGRISLTNGFTSPGWGGVTVYNPPGCGNLVSNNSGSYKLSSKDLEPVVGVIVAQIRALFGLPSMFVKNAKTSTYGVPAAVTGIADWEVDVLLRRRTAMDIQASASTLLSLSRLVSSLPNMVIKDEIGEHVSSFERLFIFGGQMCF